MSPEALPASRSMPLLWDTESDRAFGRKVTELYHAERVLRPLKLGSHAELRFTQDVIGVARLPQTGTSGLHEHLRMLWVDGHDLLQRRPVLLPYETVHLDCTVEPIPGSRCFPLTSNGLASGNHLLEAITHGICEVIGTWAGTAT